MNKYRCKFYYANGLKLLHIYFVNMTSLNEWVIGEGSFHISLKRTKKCIYRGCASQGIYNMAGKNIGLFCGKHKSALMINIVQKLCDKTGCDSKQPSFGFKEGGKRFCSKHKEVGMINLKKTLCSKEDCGNTATHGSGKPQFCKTHKLEGMCCFDTRVCEVDGCEITASYKTKDGKKRCAKHKETEMISLKSRKVCEFAGCSKQPAFNIFSETNGRFCSMHKLPNMVDVKSPRCEYKECSIIGPAFAYKGDKTGRFCSSHKMPDMINVKSKHCEYEGCDSICRAFDIKGGKGKFCAKHKSDGMIDVKNRICILDNCETHASYGKPGKSRTHCAKHRLAGMILRPNAVCEICNEPAIWGSNWNLKHCEIHKTEDDKNLAERTCKSCGLIYILDDNNNCENCNPNFWKPVALAKQNALMNYLDSRNLKGISTDKIVDGGICGKERPDRIFDFGDKIVIVECDEHQHLGRSCECEQTRMMNISQSFGGIPVYFIRWNPDEYDVEDNKICQEDIKKRHKLVADFITDIKDSRLILPKSFVSAIYMFFDGWTNLANEKWHTIADYELNACV